MFLRSILLLIFGTLASTLVAQNENVETVFLIRLDVSSPEEAKLCYTNQFDKERVRIDFAFEDTINYLADFIYEEDEMYGPDCFVPEIKLAFKYYTYVISLYCAQSIMYKNSAPYKASATRIPNDIVFTQSVYDYLNNLKNKKLGRGQTSLALLKKTVTDVPLEDLNLIDFDDLNLEGDEDEEEDDDKLSEEDEELMKQEDPPVLPKKHKIIPLEIKEKDGDGDGR
jgi:hypothetical protein